MTEPWSLLKGGSVMKKRHMKDMTYIIHHITKYKQQLHMLIRFWLNNPKAVMRIYKKIKLVFRLSKKLS